VTTAIAVYNSDGCVGRCDAKCHYATSPDCDCICGGRLHGSKSQAIERNTRDLLGDDLADALKAFAERNGFAVDELRVELADVQQELEL
jgi:hypothetical protein